MRANYVVKVWRPERCRACGQPIPRGGRWMSVWRGFSLVRARQVASTLEPEYAAVRVYVC
jgi:hypothetical protein